MRQSNQKELASSGKVSPRVESEASVQHPRVLSGSSSASNGAGKSLLRTSASAPNLVKKDEDPGLEILKVIPPPGLRGSFAENADSLARLSALAGTPGVYGLGSGLPQPLMNPRLMQAQDPYFMAMQKCK